MKFIKFDGQYVNAEYIVRVWHGIKSTHGHDFVTIETVNSNLHSEEYDTSAEAQQRCNALMTQITGGNSRPL